MPAYPAALPPPQPGWSAVLRDRAQRSTLPGDPKARRSWTDKVADVQATWTYTAEEMAEWWPWFRDDLKDGQLWFSAGAPGSGGFITRVMRYRPGSVTVTPLGLGVSRVTAQLEQRGR